MAIRQEWLRDWSFGIANKVGQVVEIYCPREAYRFPLLRSWSSEGYLWRGDWGIIVLRNRHSGVHVVQGVKPLEDPSVPVGLPNAINLHVWQEYIRTRFLLSEEDVGIIIRLIDGASSTEEEWNGWTAEDKALWERQIQEECNRLYCYVMGIKPGRPNMNTVFYSWQTDLDARVNRNFINSALEKAVKSLKRDGVEVDQRIEQDARDCPGAADIAAELFRKIRECRVFVGDVSIINPGASTRLTPNPNVMVELGYAAYALSWDRVICVVNEAYGKVEQLPFDIRPRAMVRYSLELGASEEQRKAVKEELQGKLKSALETAFQATEAERAQQQKELEERQQRLRVIEERERLAAEEREKKRKAP